MSTNARSRAWVEVRGASIRNNLMRIRESAGPGARLIPMVKANAYGLGVAPMVAALEPLDPWAYGVATVDEGIQLRALGVIRPVVVFSPIPPGDELRAVQARLQISVSDPDSLSRFAQMAGRAGRPGGFHLEVDTGIGRAGLPVETIAEWGPQIVAAVDGLEWVGVFTHFHSADHADPESSETQWELLQGAVATLMEMGAPEGLMVHACNSPGVLRNSGWAGSAVRPGIFLYGGEAGAALPGPEEVASLRARVVHIRDAPAGASVGYGATHRAAQPERWATLAIGYGDGLPRILSNRGHAILAGRRVPIVGRISMDVTVVDITGLPQVRCGDVATLMGSDGDESISVDEVADLAGTINYEILTGLAPRLPRVWLDDDE